MRSRDLPLFRRTSPRSSKSVIKRRHLVWQLSVNAAIYCASRASAQPSFAFSAFPVFFPTRVAIHSVIGSQIEVIHIKIDSL